MNETTVTQADIDLATLCVPGALIFADDAEHIADARRRAAEHIACARLATPAPDSEKLREALATLLSETRSYLADAPVGHAVHEAIERADRILMTPGASS